MDPTPRSLWSLVATLQRHSPVVIRGALLFALAVALLVVLMPRRFTTTVSFRPSSGGALPGQIGSLATQFGVRVPADGNEEPPDFYVTLIQSQELLGRMARRRYAALPERGARLDTILELRERHAAEREERTIRWLREKAISASVDPLTAVVSVSVRTRWAPLSREIAATVLDEVDRYNRQRRQSQSVAERRFAEVRLSVVRGELDSADRALTEFLATNRSIAASPELLAERERLEREVAIRQQVYASVASMLEEARLAEVRSTPVISVVQPAYQPVLPDKRGLVTKFAAALLFGLVAGYGLVVLWVAVRPASDAERDSFTEVVSRARAVARWGRRRHRS